MLDEGVGAQIIQDFSCYGGKQTSCQSPLANYSLSICSHVGLKMPPIHFWVIMLMFELTLASHGVNDVSMMKP